MQIQAEARLCKAYVAASCTVFFKPTASARQSVETAAWAIFPRPFLLLHPDYGGQVGPSFDPSFLALPRVTGAPGALGVPGVPGATGVYIFRE